MLGGVIDRAIDRRLVQTALKRSRIGIECKRTDAPTLSPSMRVALTDLRLDTLLVAYPGTKRYSLADEVEVVPLPELVGAR